MRTTSFTAAFVVLLAGLQSPALAEPGYDDLPLSLVLKHLDKEQVDTNVLRKGEQLFISQKDFIKAYGKHVPADVVTLDNLAYIAAASLGTLTVVEEDLTAVLELRADLMPAQRFGMASSRYSIEPTPLQGLKVNYGVDYLRSARLFTLASTTTYAFANGATLNGALAYNNRDGVRLGDMSYNRILPQSNAELVVGSTASTSSALASPFSIVGVQLRSNHLFNPFFTPYVSSSINGTAEFEGTAELFINGLQSVSRKIRPGDYAFEGLSNSLTSNGEAVVVLRDINGRVIRQTTPLLGAPKNLRAGVFTYGAEVGALGSLSGVNGFAASGTANYGWSDHLTLQGHAEAASSVRHVGASAILATNLGTFMGGALLGSGSVWNAGYYRQSERLQVNLDYKRYQDYQAMGTQEQDKGRTDAVLTASALYRLPSNHTISALYAQNRTDSRLSLGSSFQLSKNVNLGVTVSRSKSQGNSVFLSLDVALGGSSVKSSYDTSMQRASVSSYQRTDQLNTVNHGVQVLASPSGKQALGELGYNTQWADLLASIDNTGNFFTSAKGSVVWVDGKVKFSRPVPDAYVVIDASAPGIAFENHSGYKGRTGSDGLLVVPTASMNDQSIQVQMSSLPDAVMVNDYKFSFNAYPNSPVRVKVETEILK